MLVVLFVEVEVEVVDHVGFELDQVVMVVVDLVNLSATVQAD